MLLRQFLTGISWLESKANVEHQPRVITLQKAHTVLHIASLILLWVGTIIASVGFVLFEQTYTNSPFRRSTCVVFLDSSSISMACCLRFLTVTRSAAASVAEELPFKA